MNKLLFIYILFIASSLSSYADDLNNLQQSTATPPNARFEIVQSQLLVKNTFRLDRFTGRISQLVKTSADEMTWENMIVEKLPQIEKPIRARFQLFNSGLLARCTYLIDTDTGKTWILVETTDKDNNSDYLWEPFK
ncbi:MAG: hypothetical protein P4L34_01990 [Paludibacter sp.]|nr:hypothetical protein [Paludibacter sp.]